MHPVWGRFASPNGMLKGQLLLERMGCRGGQSPPLPARGPRYSMCSLSHSALCAQSRAGGTSSTVWQPICPCAAMRATARA